MVNPISQTLPRSDPPHPLPKGGRVSVYITFAFLAHGQEAVALRVRERALPSGGNKGGFLTSERLWFGDSLLPKQIQLPIRFGEYGVADIDDAAFEDARP